MVHLVAAKVWSGASRLAPGELVDGCDDRTLASGALRPRIAPTPDGPGNVHVSLVSSLVLSNSFTLRIVGPLGAPSQTGARSVPTALLRRSARALRRAHSLGR
jgi:hypothetical protein